MNEILSHSNEPITLVTLGPLTNIALLFNTYPECKNYVKEIIMMGGSTGRGNVTPLLSLIFIVILKQPISF